MSSRFRSGDRSSWGLGALSALALLAGCDRESRDTGKPVAETVPMVETSDLYPGLPNPSPPDPRAAQYEGNAYHISQGQQLYKWMNCVGCHANGGGGIGPALMDDQWRYGGRMEQIVATLEQGRPNGMPAWRGKLTEQQMWQLAAYVRSLSGQAPKDAVSSRPDAMSSIPPLTLKEREAVIDSSPAGVQGTAQ
jgi:cytochrome c oxidase cbb3-type subunit 3